MKTKFFVASAVLAAIIGGYAVPVAMADEATIVQVNFWDNGTDKEMVTTMGMGGTGDHSMANMGFKLSQDKVKAGEVTFQATNDSKETIHEMLIIPLAEGATVPVDQATNEINEDQAGSLGEISELDPGKTSGVSFNLKPGKYLLACNIAGHYQDGMWAILTVE